MIYELFSKSKTDNSNYFEQLSFCTMERMSNRGVSSEGKRSEPKLSSSKCRQGDGNVIEDDKAVGMETAQRVGEEKSEDNGRDISEECLSIPLILRRILEQLSDKELIDLSLVNRLWNYEARSVLRDRGCLTARIYSTILCLKRFASDLQRMRAVPFTGIRLLINHSGGHPYEVDDVSQFLPSESLAPSYRVILDQLPWKHLSVQFCGESWTLEYWSVFLVERILEKHSGVLEELSFKYYTTCQRTIFKLSTIFRRIFQYRSFPCLKILKFDGQGSQQRGPCSSYTSAFVKMLVSCSPSLERLYMDGLMAFNKNVMEGRSAVLVATSGLHPFREQFCESLIHALRTESIQLFRCDSVPPWTDHWNYDVELLNRYVPMIIRASRTTLKTLSMDLLFIVPLMCYEILLENVTNLVIRVPGPFHGDIQPYISALLKGFDFTRVFPKLEKIKTLLCDFRHLPSDDISAFVERGTVVARETLPDRAINIRHLELQYNENNYFFPPLIFLAQMFPHVKTLSVETMNREFSYELLWEHFGCLEELHVDLGRSYGPGTKNLDSVFCGIFPEEVAELRTKDDEYLKAVNIVPVMPSITCLRGLRLFTLRYGTRYYHLRADSTRIFSKVTGLIGFLRCPDLSVEFKTTRYIGKPLDHMKPYVTAITQGPIS